MKSDKQQKLVESIKKQFGGLRTEQQTAEVREQMKRTSQLMLGKKLPVKL